MAETWKTIPRQFSNYEISDLGRVRNKRTGRFLTPCVDKKTWFYRLYPEGGRKQVKKAAGVLVWNVFNGHIPYGHFVQYRNGNRRDFSLKNLYLKSSSEFDEWIFG